MRRSRINPLKVLQIMGHGAFGGGSRIVLAISSDLAKRGLEVVVNCSDPEEVRAFHEIGLRTVPIPELRSDAGLVEDAIALWKLWRLCRQERPHIVHTHTSKGGILGRVSARLAGVPIVIHHVHGLAIHNYSTKANILVYAWLERLAAYLCDLIIAVSEWERQKMLSLRITTSERIVTVPNGIDPTQYLYVIPQPYLRQEMGLDDGQKVVAFFGRICKQKGPRYFIEAIPLIMRQCHNIAFLVVGEGPLRPELESLSANLGIQQNVNFAGFRRDIPALLSLVDVVVVPSLWEGFGIALAEAMAAGKPVVASQVDAIPELVEGGVTGIMVQPEDVTAFARAILWLLNNGEKAEKMGRAGRERVTKNFTEVHMKEKIWELYQQLITEKLHGSVRKKPGSSDSQAGGEFAP